MFLNYLQEHFPDNYEHFAAKYAQYAVILERDSQVMNLTAIDPKEYYEKHFLDCLLLRELYDFRDEKLIDVGTGAGFPGLVLAIAYPNLAVTLLEPTMKKCVFLESVIKDLKLTNVTVVNKRAEDYTEMREAFDLATTRAVAALNIILELCAPLVKKGGSVLAMKGKNYNTELNEAANAIYVLKLELGKQKTHFLPSDGSMRANIRFVKRGLTDRIYPRSYSQIKKKPL